MKTYIAIVRRDRRHWWVEIENRTGQSVAGAQLNADQIDKFIAHYDAELVSDARVKEQDNNSNAQVDAPSGARSAE